MACPALGVRTAGFLLLFQWVSTALPLPVLADTSSGRIGMAMNDLAIWVYSAAEEQRDSDGGPLLRVVYRKNSGFRSEPFLPRLAQAITGRAIRAVALGETLHLFFMDGTHMAYSPAVGPLGPYGLTSARELNLPGGVRPLAFAADANGEFLYVVITTRQAVPLMKPTTSSGEEKGAAATKVESGEGRSESPMETSESFAPLSLVRFDQGVWAVDRPAPEELGLEGTVLQLWASGTTVHMVYRTGAEKTHWVSRSSANRSEAWTDSVDVPIQGFVRISSGGWHGGRPVLAVGLQSGVGIAIETATLEDGAWESGENMVDGEGRSLHLPEPAALAVQGDRLAMATISDGGDPRIGIWNLSGRLEEPWMVIEPLKKDAITQESPRLRQFVEYAVLAVVLTMVFLWRRNSVAYPATLEPNLRFAMISRRLLALLIDLAMITPAWAIVVVLMLMKDDLPLAEQLALAGNGLLPQLYWAPAILGGLLGLYGTIAEPLGGTLGKRAMGLKVVCITGGPHRLARAFVRNVTRVVEFHFPPLALLAVVTASRQRLGDLLARTIVIESLDVSQALPTQEIDEPPSSD